jgi:hypothetical protein
MPSFAPPPPQYPQYQRDVFALQFLKLAERWEDMKQKLSKIHKWRGGLEAQERNLLLECFDNMIQPLRKAWRTGRAAKAKESNLEHPEPMQGIHSFTLTYQRKIVEFVDNHVPIIDRIFHHLSFKTFSNFE